MTFSRRAALALLAAATFAATPLAAQTLEEIKAKNMVSVGMLVDFPPFGIMDANGQPDGYDADVAKLLAEDLGVDLTIVPVTGPNRIPYLLSGQVDVLVASLGITAERAERVAFSEPYAGIAIAVYGETDVDLSSPDKLVGHAIGVTRASTQDSAVTAVAPEGATIQRFDDDASAVQALLSGQVEAIGVSNIIINQIEQVAPGRFEVKFDLSQQKQGIAVRPGSDALLAEINAFVEKAKADGKLNEIHEKWLGSPLPDFLATAN
jgi:polar amino acid transport system substrate-binding protein